MTTTTHDVKVEFVPLDCSPGDKDVRRWRRDALGSLGRTDDDGFSLMQHLLGQDRGGPAAGAPGFAGGAAGAKQLAARNKRANESFSYLFRHIAIADVRTVLVDRFRGDGHGAWEWLMENWMPTMTTTEIQKLDVEWLQLNIVRDIGVSPSTVSDTVMRLQVMNSERPLAARKTDDEIVERLLDMVAASCSWLQVEATNELNAPAGIVGAAGVRRFQVIQAGVPVRHLRGVIEYFGTAWKRLVQAKQLTASAPTGQSGTGPSRHTVGAGMMSHATRRDPRGLGYE